jgi:tRNA (guanine6-N2)-methyltransferase
VRATSSDTDQQACSIARKNLAKCEGLLQGTVAVEQWNAAKLPLDNSSVDAIVCDMPFGRSFGNSWRNKGQVPSVLKEWLRVLKPGSRCVLLRTYSDAIIESSGAASMQGQWQIESFADVNIGGISAGVVVLIRL